jgi:protein-tyrosine kinase
MDRIVRAIERARESRPKRTAGPVSDSQEAIQYTRTKVIAVPGAQLRKRKLVAGDEKEAGAAAYKVLRTRILRLMGERGWRTLGITSIGKGEGKTLTAANLALAIAEEVNHTVILVDADLRRPTLHRIFGIEAEKGLPEYLLNDEPVENILCNPGVERLVILPGSRPVSKSSEQLSSRRMTQLVDEMRTRYPSRIVVFDLPPISAGDDVLAFAPKLDAILLVVEERKTRIDQLSQLVPTLDGVNLIGTVLNKSSAAGAPYEAY